MAVKAIDVAAYIVENSPLMTTMKLQKLVYYSYVEHARVNSSPLFDDEIQAWVNGAVIPALYRLHRREYLAYSRIFDGEDIKPLDEVSKASVDRALERYGHLKPKELSELNHSEDPWRLARVGCSTFEPSTNQITFDAVKRWIA